jgi:branched-chain amino acid transport system substrate-binding protein
MKKIIIILLAFVLISGCGSEKKDTIKIGAIVFKTGDAAQYGEWVMNGLNLALSEINSNGGINGKNVEIIFEDDQTNAKVAVTAINKLISTQNTPVIIAGLTSQSTLAIAPIAEKKHVVLFSPCSSSPALTNSGDYIFRNWPSDNQEGKLMANYAFSKLKLRNIAVLAMQNDYGIGLQKVFIEQFKKLGGNIILDEYFDEGDTNFRPIISKLRTLKFDAIYMPSHALEAGSFLKQLFESNLSYQVLGCVTYESPELINIAGSAANNVIFTTPSFNTESKDTLLLNFISKYKEKYGENPENFAAQSYDALMIIVLAIKKGGFTADGIKDALYKIKNYKGVSGLTSFDKNGDVSKPSMIKKVKNGKFITIDLTND